MSSVDKAPPTESSQYLNHNIDLFLGSPHIFYLILAAQKALTNMSRSLLEKAFSAFSLKWLRDEVFSNVISEGEKVKDLLDVTAESTHSISGHYKHIKSTRRIWCWLEIRNCVGFLHLSTDVRSINKPVSCSTLKW